MKIAVFHDLPSGGAKRTLYEVVKRLSERHKLDVFTLDTANMYFCDLSEWAHAHYVFHFSPSKLFRSPLGRLNQLQRWRDLQRLDKLSRQISKEIDSGKYDLVFAQPCMWTQAPLVLRYLSTPAIYYCQEPPRFIYDAPSVEVNGTKKSWKSKLDVIDPFIYLYRSTVRKFDKIATQSANLVLVNSRFIQNQTKDIYGINAIINYHGIDTNVFHPGQNVAPKVYVLSVGAIQPHKGYDFLIESLSYIPKELRPSLRLIGNVERPGEYMLLQKLAKKHEVDLQIEVGVSQEILIQRYIDAALVAYAPYNEPFGLVPLEAMACGKPVVGVREGGIQETVVHEYTGLLTSRNPREFGNAIKYLLENPRLIEEYGRNGRAHVLANWTWEKTIADLEKNFDNIA